jgi:hypothetical protein
MEDIERVENPEVEIPELGKLIDMDESTFPSFISELNSGYVSSIKLILESTYFQLKNMKQAILIQRTEENAEKTDKLIEGIYIQLLKIERKIEYISEELHNRGQSVSAQKSTE